MSEIEVIRALFSQPKPIIFSMKGGLEKMGKGHHKTSHMNREQHTEALIEGLKFKGQGVKEDWTGGDPWSIILSFANLKKPLNDQKLNAIWEKVKENKKWDDSYSSIGFKSVQRPGGVREDFQIPEEAQAVQPDPVPEIPAEAPIPKQVQLVSEVKNKRISELEAKVKEQLLEINSLKKEVEKVEARQIYSKQREERLEEEIKSLKIQLKADSGSVRAQKPGEEIELKYYFNRDDKFSEEFTYQGRNYIYEFPYGQGEGIIYNNDGDKAGKAENKTIGEPRDGAGRKVENRSQMVRLINIEIFDEPIEDDPPPVGLGGDSDSDGSSDDSDEPIDYEDDILEDEVNGRDYIVNKKNGKLWDDDMNEVGTADFEGDKITKIYLNKDKTKEQIKLKNEEAKKVAFEDALSSGLLDKEPEIKEIDLDDFDPDDFVEIEFEDMDYLINDEVEEPHPVYSMTGKYVGKWVENLGIVFENKEAEKWHESQQSPRKDPVMTPGLSADIEDQKPPSPVPESEEELSSESDIESSESDIESSDEDSDDSEIEGLWRVQIDYVDLLVGEEDDYQQTENGGFKYSLTDTEAEYLGFFKDWKEKDNQPINWNDLKGFEWFSKEAKANYIEQRNELLDDEGIDTDRYSIPQRIRSLQIGGMTKGHFHKEVPVILHGGELVIPKKHVSQVMAQSELAKQISKIPPTWQKIKEIIK
tara:strand:- start:4230 stop:6329 length:2100 start_codon:yes stop_codon:yes gene_type:complete